MPLIVNVSFIECIRIKCYWKSIWSTNCLFFGRFFLRFDCIGENTALSPHAKTTKERHKLSTRWNSVKHTGQTYKFPSHKRHVLVKCRINRHLRKTSGLKFKTFICEPMKLTAIHQRLEQY